MQAGIEIYDALGNQIFGMDDFTYERIYQSYIPKGSANFAINIPGYNPANCFVILTPAAFAGYDQPGWNDGWGFSPYYRNNGGESVTIICQRAGGVNVATILEAVRTL